MFSKNVFLFGQSMEWKIDTERAVDEKLFSIVSNGIGYYGRVGSTSKNSTQNKFPKKGVQEQDHSFIFPLALPTLSNVEPDIYLMFSFAMKSFGSQIPNNNQKRMSFSLGTHSFVQYIDELKGSISFLLCSSLTPISFASFILLLNTNAALSYRLPHKTHTTKKISSISVWREAEMSFRKR